MVSCHPSKYARHSKLGGYSGSVQVSEWQIHPCDWDNRVFGGDLKSKGDFGKLSQAKNLHMGGAQVRHMSLLWSVEMDPKN